MDELKKYLLEKRNELDADVPGDAVWTEVKNRTKKKSLLISFNRLGKIGIAAAFLAAVVFTVLYLDREKVGPPPISKKGTDQKQILQQDEEKRPVLPPVKKNTDDVAERKSPVPGRSFSPAVNTPGIESEEVNKDLAPQVVIPFEHDVTGLIQTQLSFVNNLAVYTETETYFAVYKEQWKALEQKEAILKAGLKRETGNDMVAALIHLYKQKLELLEDLRFEIMDMNAKAEALGKDNIIKPYYFTL